MSSIFGIKINEDDNVSLVLIWLSINLCSIAETDFSDMSGQASLGLGDAT